MDLPRWWCRRSNPPFHNAIRKWPASSRTKVMRMAKTTGKKKKKLRHNWILRVAGATTRLHTHNVSQACIEYIYIFRKNKCFHSISDSLSFCAVIQSLNGRKVNIKCAQRFHYVRSGQIEFLTFFFSCCSNTTSALRWLHKSRKETERTKNGRIGTTTTKNTREKNEKCARVSPGMCVNLCVYVCHFNKKRMQGSSLIWCWRWWWWRWWWWIAAAGIISFAKQKLQRQNDQQYKTILGFFFFRFRLWEWGKMSEYWKGYKQRDTAKHKMRC